MNWQEDNMATISTDHAGNVTVDVGQIQSEKHRVTSDLVHENFPLSDTHEAEAYDYEGVKRVITLNATKTFTSKQSLMDDFVVKLNGLQNGDQETVVYLSDIWANSTTGDYTDGKFNVKVASFDWSYVTGNPQTISYTLVLYESV